MGAQIKNQNYNDQVKQEGKNKKNKKTANPSTLGMYYGGTNQEPKLQ